ncbi:MAG: formate--tetrahydrofolate ligase [Firmicutes bacterium]|nr:formate--tetrahydrofolate ligase [Bacillota bacterium]
MTDIEIARAVKLQLIETVAKKIGINDIIPYGHHIAKIEPKPLNKKAKVILVTAINPTSAGEGKTTVSVGLADGLSLLGHKTALALREPSLGPVFGIKGGAAGGGYSQIAPMDDINLHFTGDLHAITTANNLLSALIDNHIYWGNSLSISKVTHRRCLDMNERALRNVEVGIGYNQRHDNFDITAACEVMAILSLAKDEKDLKTRLGDIIVGENKDGQAVYARDLKAQEAMAIVLKDAIKPNLVQTLIGTPAFVHAGPFANIAHGCNSIMATATATHYADFVVTEAGFGADLGAEKFLDIKSRQMGLVPSGVVIVATIRALKAAGGVKENLGDENMAALEAGFLNLKGHIENIKGVFKLDCVVAINKFVSDTDKEIAFIKNECEKLGTKAILSEGWAKGGEGVKDLAKEVAKLDSKKLEFVYELSDSPEEKIKKIAAKIYGADDVIFEDKAKEALKKLKGNQYPVCVAKTQYSFSDNKDLLGRPKGFKITIRDILLKNGSKFLVAIAGDIMLMPGLSKVPSAEKMSINDGVITGLF